MSKVPADPMIARDLVGYGEFPPDPKWPGDAVIAVNFNLNVEGGGEATLANGDDGSEGMLNDIGVPGVRGRRVPLVESVFEYGSRRGVWRVLSVADNVTLWPIFDRARDDRWSGDRVVLIGDACHPVRPFMAAGGAMAIEDGAILSRCIVEFDDTAEAFACYAATRIPRVADVQRISLENSWMGGPTDTDWLYCYDPCTAELTRSY